MAEDELKRGDNKKLLNLSDSMSEDEINEEDKFELSENFLNMFEPNKDFFEIFETNKEEISNSHEINMEDHKNDKEFSNLIENTNKLVKYDEQGQNMSSSDNDITIKNKEDVPNAVSVFKSKKDKNLEIKRLFSLTNTSFVRNDFPTCISLLKTILSLDPKNPNAYFMLGLIFEELKDDLKSYNFFLISSQLMRSNYQLWHKLYELSTKYNLLLDKLYFIQKLQRNKNTRELVVEKLQIYKILKYKYKVLETKIELFYFDGVDFNIFNVIRNETRHKRRTGQCALLLIKYFKENPNKCGLGFLCEIIRLQYETGYFYGTRNLIEKYLINTSEMTQDIRIIYIICVLINRDTTKNEEIQDKSDDIEDLDNFEDAQFRESLFEAQGSVFKNIISKDKSYSKTLNINTILSNDCSFTDLESLINDEYFWNNFKESKYIKGLLKVLENLSMFDLYLEILNKLEHKVTDMREFVYKSKADFYYKKGDLNNSLFYYQKILEINPDLNSVKTNLYEIYKKLGNVDLANKFCTVASLINFVDDIENKNKFECSKEKCNENRDLYTKSRVLFKENRNEEYFVSVRPLVDEFLENRLIFPKYKKHKLFTKDSNLIENLSAISSNNDTHVRYLSLSGLNIDEWSAVLLEFTISNIKKGNLKEASHLLKKSLECEIFKKRQDIYLQFIFMTIKHCIFYNDLHFLTSCIKKAIKVTRDYSWSNLYFYLLNFFPDYILKRSYGNIQMNIRRTYKRNGQCLKNKENAAISTYKNLDLNILLSSFFVKNIAKRSYKILKDIVLNDNFRDKMTYYLILIITYKCRNNETKNEMLKEGINGLKKLLEESNKEEYCNVCYNLGVTYHTLGYVGIAEKYYKEAMKSQNKELRRMGRLSLMIVYRKNNSHLLKKLYDEDETT
ncbi:transcription factor tau-like protein [Vairimorpha necatrix]|uniref:Transcription factor tau-like protein n=1 Tax=Vairimorpha necatrix TaxID=6039 RepID=A0AAX4JDB8_9MICR